MNNNQDPWSGNNDQRPPDLDDVINEFKSKFSGFMGGSGNKDNNDGAVINKNHAGKFKYIFIIAIIVWLLSGFYIIDPAERGVIKRFGSFVEITKSGPHWHIPYPVETVTVVNVSEVRIAEIGFRSLKNNNGSKFSRKMLSESIMLTSDGNIVDASFEIQYTINDAKYYLFNVKNPEKTLNQVANSAIREVIGKHKIDYIITEGRGSIAQEVKEKSQKLLDFYKVGLRINTVNFKSAQAPDQVQAAYSDVTKAKTDKKRFVNQAQSYANDIIPRARGKSARVLEEANAYRAEVIAKSEGEANRFLQILSEYEKSPVVTKERLYRETLENVFSKTTKIITGSNNNSLMYLPIDKLINNKQQEQIQEKNFNTTNNNNTGGSTNIRSAFRNRGGE